MGCPFKALADDRRRRILEVIYKSPSDGLEAGRIAEEFNISKPAISGHLKILMEADLLTMEKLKQFRYYKVNGIGFREIEEYLNKFS